MPHWGEGAWNDILGEGQWRATNTKKLPTDDRWELAVLHLKFVILLFTVLLLF
jgi:hypothetical protein